MPVNLHCDGKVQHKSQSSVDYYMTHINSDANAQPYLCTDCGFWHIGTKNGNKQIKKKTRKSVTKGPTEEVVKIKRMKL